MSPFEEIYSENYHKMHRVAIKILGDNDNACDIVQEIFLYLFERLNNGIEILNISGWLYKATVNKCMDNLRTKKRFHSIDSASHVIVDVEFPDKEEAIAAVNLAMKKLNPREKVLLVLYSEGLSYKDISESTGMKFSSIGKSLSRSLDKLEKELKNNHYEMY